MILWQFLCLGFDYVKEDFIGFLIYYGVGIFYEFFSGQFLCFVLSLDAGMFLLDLDTQQQMVLPLS